LLQPEELGEVQVVAEGEAEAPAPPGEGHGALPGEEAPVALFSLGQVEVDLVVDGAFGKNLEPVARALPQVAGHEEDPGFLGKRREGFRKGGRGRFPQDQLGQEQKPRSLLTGGPG
jgi:hypothetical protein